MAPTWVDLGGMLEHFWSMFWVLFCSLLLRYSWRRFLVDFSSIFDPPEEQKTLKNQWFFNIFVFFASSLLRPLLDRFWVDFWSILEPKIVPKSSPKGSSKGLKIMIVFQCLFEPQKINFLVDMAPAWLDLAPQDGPKLAPKWGQSRSQNGLGSEVSSGTDFGTILGRFWDDFGTILGRFLDDFG